MTLHLRDFVPADLEWALALNNEAVPAVNVHDLQSLEALIGGAHYTRVAVGAEGGGIGLLVVFAAGAAYDSPNFQWFQEEYEDFLYVDRVVVDPGARSLGVGQALYEDLFSFAEGRTARITCEVNRNPPNPESLRFHRRAGFVPVGEQHTEAGAKQVLLLSKPIATVSY